MRAWEASVSNSLYSWRSRQGTVYYSGWPGQRKLFFQRPWQWIVLCLSRSRQGTGYYSGWPGQIKILFSKALAINCFMFMEVSARKSLWFRVPKLFWTLGRGGTLPFKAAFFRPRPLHTHTLAEMKVDTWCITKHCVFLIFDLFDVFPEFAFCEFEWFKLQFPDLHQKSEKKIIFWFFWVADAEVSKNIVLFFTFWTFFMFFLNLNFVNSSGSKFNFQVYIRKIKKPSFF